MRTLKKHLEKIYRKVAFKLVQGGLGGDAAASPTEEPNGGPEMRLQSPAGSEQAPSVSIAPAQLDGAQGGAAASGSSPSTFPEVAGAEDSLASTLETEPAPGALSADSSSSGSSGEGEDGGGSSSSSSGEAVSKVERVLEGDAEPVRVDVGDLKGYLGQPPFTSDRIYDQTPPGVVMGLAW